MLVCTFTEFVKTFFEGFSLGLITIPVLYFIYLWIMSIKK